MEPEGVLAAVMDAFWRPAVCQAATDLYREIEVEVARRKPVCAVSGRCCKFDEFGHRLYVTTIELATFLHEYLDRPLNRLRQAAAAWDGKSCPFQSDRLCDVHTMRPMGCRMFFCDASSNQWQNEQYEKFHGRLKRLHESLAVPYAYLEWRSALAMLGFK
jgi:Fe-S-cluster containining protein